MQHMIDEGSSEKTTTIEDNWADIVEVAPNHRIPRAPEVERIKIIVDELRGKGVDISDWMVRDFSDPALYPALPDNIRNNQELLSSYIENSAKFDSIIHTERSKRYRGNEDGLFGKEVSIPESLHANGRVRRAESGYSVHPEYLRTVGIDPEKVLFYRVTQPSEIPKPEFYWTSDYQEVVAGLHVETGGEYRKTAVILAADMLTISKNEGLIQDVNDDQGLAVRQIGLGSFDQKNALAVFRPDDFKKADGIRSELVEIAAKEAK